MRVSFSSFFSRGLAPYFKESASLKAMHKSESTSDTSALSPSVGESAAITSNSKVDVSAESVFFTISVALSEKASASYDAESFIFVTL